MLSAAGASRRKAFRSHLEEETDMNAIKVETIVNEAMAQAIPALRPLLGQRVEVIALQTERPPTKRITLDEFLTHRLVPPHGVRLSLEDMESAIEKSAAGGTD
jgi:hypothetical protein